jgi:hypothetical protein
VVGFVVAQDAPQVAQDQDLRGLPPLLTQPRGDLRDQEEDEPQAHERWSSRPAGREGNPAGHSRGRDSRHAQEEPEADLGWQEIAFSRLAKAYGLVNIVGMLAAPTPKRATMEFGLSCSELVQGLAQAGFRFVAEAFEGGHEQGGDEAGRALEGELGGVRYLGSGRHGPEGQGVNGGDCLVFSA